MPKKNKFEVRPSCEVTSSKGDVCVTRGYVCVTQGFARGLTAEGAGDTNRLLALGAFDAADADAARGYSTAQHSAVQWRSDTVESSSAGLVSGARLGVAFITNRGYQRRATRCMSCGNPRWNP